MMLANGLSPVQTSEFFLTSFFCSCVREKIDKFSSFSTRKMLMKIMSRKNIVKKKMSDFAYALTGTNKACQGKHVRRTDV